MKTTKKAQRLLERISQIQQMERGKICKMSGRNHFNHQTWHEGKNVVRYVPREEIGELQQAINAYTLFSELVCQYANEMIRLTRLERIKRSRPRSQKQKNLDQKKI